MAKVYSWEISNGVYAYIVDPNNTNRALVSRGEITNQKQLQIITDWTQNATDTEYDAQFEKMLTECVNRGYNAVFEDASAYRGVTTTCDNLRGPAGRGISTIEYLRSLTEDDGTFSVYTIKYDDGTNGTLKIREGKDGRDGIDGKPGAPGDAGVSSKLIMIYTSGVDADGNIIIPERPQGGSYDFISNEFVCPDGWSRNDGDDGSLTPPIWQSTRTFASTEASTDKQWSDPVQITGESGKPGEDGISTEFIYFLGSNPPRGEALPSENVPGFVPDESWGTTASPEGVDEDNKTEYCYTRTKNKETGVWGGWNGPTIWSKYGENGQDGDGVQYIFLKNKGQAPHNPTPFGYDAFDTTDPKIKEIFENYQNKDTEWLPPTGYQYTNLYGSGVTFTAIEELPEGSDKTPAGIWSDDPSDVDNEFQFIWVSSRKYRKSQESGKKMWTKFSDPTLWAKFGQDGRNATSIRRLYKLTSSTGSVPDLPEDPTMTADWGTGFPKDYKYGENVVWATEAEIWAHNFEFVYSYRKVSEVDKDGNVIPPKDATAENSLEVPYIPDSQTGYEGITYLIYDGHYYKWDGGWCEPFLVTGVKGDPGDPIDYTTYVFAFGYTDYPPDPPTGSSPAFPGESAGKNNILVQWRDFPDTSLYRDGVQENGADMRWFQCGGQVEMVATSSGYAPQIKKDDNGNLKWGTVTPCNPRDGEGQTGPYYEFRFGITKDDKEPPKNFVIDNVWIRKPEYYIDNEQYGWFDTDDKMPAIPAGGAMWQIWALIDPETDTVLDVKGKGWNGPRRISGEKGEQGLQGPAGLRGVSGLPGAAQHTMYCLGTYGKDKSEYYFDIYTDPNVDKVGDGYFGDKDFQGKTIEDLEKKGWYSTKNMPYSDVIKVVNDTEFGNAYKNPENQGRVIRYIRSTANSANGSTFVNTTHQYYLVGQGGGYYKQLTGLLTEKESEEFDIYVWCIQGNDKWSTGKSAFYKKLTSVPEDANDNNTQTRNDIPATKVDDFKYLRDAETNEYYMWVEIDGGSVEHIFEGVEWSSPFKLQGTNGLRGLAGNRGQVVYPMGVYNHEEVYITTETKAPYVYDPNDGLFYVYNIVGQPWVGRLPGYNEDTKEYDDTYKYIMIHPDDAEVNFKDVDYDPTTQRNEVPGYKYLRYNGNYYIWSDTTYVMASKYKYSDDGGITWMTDQDGDTPANNFANAGTGVSPAWVRFESFQALYTNIGIIANGMIGSAVYNNEFMFSQQGINKQGEKTNYAVVSGKPGNNDDGFLSGYEFSETPNKVSLGEGKGYIIQNWKYRDTEQFINDTDVNPYEKDINGEYIHGFMPNVCINFATGQMWASCGKNHFDADGTGYLANEAIKWWFDNEDKVGLQVGRDGENGIRFVDGEMTIGKLEVYKGDMEIELENINNKITAATETLSNALEEYRDDIQQQVDKRADAYYQSNDPSEGVNGEHWQSTDSSATATYAAYRVGDLWFNTSNGKSYIYASTNNGVQGFKEALYPQDVTYYWVESNVPDTVYNAINARSKIFIEQPYTPYYVGDLWFVHSNNYSSTSFYDGTTGITSGTCMVCIETNEDGNFNAGHWGRRDRYADEAQLEAAQSELELMIGQLDDWDNDGLLNPTELKLLSEEYKTIKNEYPSITGQASTVAITNTDAYSSYTTAYSKVTGMTDSYYLNANNATAGTKQDCVVIITGTTATTNWYGWYEEYYIRRQVLLKAISDKLNENTNKVKDDLTELIEDNVGILQNQIDKKAETFYQSTDPSTSWEEKDYELHEGDMWYNTSNHNTYRWNGSSWAQQEIPSDIFDMIDGKASVFVSKPTSDSDGDGYLYHVNDMWFLEKDYTNSTELGTAGKQGSIWVSTVNRTNTFTWSDWIKKGTELDNWIAGDYADELAKVQNQMDKKADTFYQANDPSSGSSTTKWLSSTTDSTRLASNHIGDLWFDTTAKKSYTYTNDNTGVISYKNALSPSGYYWVESDVPTSIYDRTDGKSSIFVTKPDSDHDGDGYLYKEGDLWLSGNTSAGSGEILRSTNDRTTAQGFKSTDWIKASKYTDDTKATQALNRLNGIGADGYVSPEEQKSLKNEKANIQKEYSSFTGQCSSYGLTTSSNAYYSKYTSYTTWYSRAISALTYYTSSSNYVSTDSSNTYYNCIKIPSGYTGTGTTEQYYGNIAQYYSARQDLQNALVSAARDKAISDGSSAASSAQTAAQNALAKQIGYSSYDDMVSKVTSNGKIVTTGGKLNADMIEATWVNAVILSAQTATVNSLTANTAWVGNLTVQKLNTTPSVSTTKGRILIEGNDIKVFENSNRNDREVLRITGDKLIELPASIPKTGTTANVTIFSSGRLNSKQTITGVCSTTLCTFTTPSEKGFSYTIKNAGNGKFYYHYPPTSTNASSVDGKVIYALYNGNSRIGTISSGSTGGNSSGSTISGYKTMSSSALTGLIPNTSYNVKAEYNVYNGGGQDIGSCYISGTTNETFTISPECNKLDVASDGIRYALSNESYFECKYDSENRIEFIMQATPSNYIKVTKSNIFMGINNKSYHGVSSGNQLTFVE